MFTEQDISMGVGSETCSYLLTYSVANYCLMRRRTAKEYERLTSVNDKMNFLYQHAEFPELNGLNYSTALELIEERNNALGMLVSEIWTLKM